MHVAVDGLALRREVDQLADLLRGEVVEALEAKVLALDLAHDRLGDAAELPQRALRQPHATLDHLAERQRLGGETRPAAVQHHLEEGAHDAAGALRHVHHVRHQRKAVQPQPADVRLQQHVHLGGRVLDGLLHRDGHAVEQLLQLALLLVAHGQVAELAAQREEAEELDVAHVPRQMLVEGGHAAVLHVVVRGHAAQVGHLQRAALAVVAHQLGAVEQRGGGVHQVAQPLAQLGVGLRLLDAHAVQLRAAQHADVQVGVAEPVDGVVDALHGAQHQLGVEVVGEARHELALDRQLVVEQREVVLQLAVAGDDDALALAVVLRAAGAAHHLADVQRAQLHPAALLGAVHLCALDDDRVRGQVHTPGERGRAHQHLDVVVGEEVLDQRAVGAAHAGVMAGEAVGQQVAQLGVLGALLGLLL
mmetsp:Transcript_1476/g.4618  ORF Transcript_1476/g.4618 Transcript_1476/m.4618 type:complete len:419 (+) Transcript_1476:3107-4363(+)